jgi:hypothetical protein
VIMRRTVIMWRSFVLVVGGAHAGGQGVPAAAVGRSPDHCARVHVDDSSCTTRTVAPSTSRSSRAGQRLLRRLLHQRSPRRCLVARPCRGTRRRSQVRRHGHRRTHVTTWHGLAPRPATSLRSKIMCSGRAQPPAIPDDRGSHGQPQDRGSTLRTPVKHPAPTPAKGPTRLLIRTALLGERGGADARGGAHVRSRTLTVASTAGSRSGSHSHRETVHSPGRRRTLHAF